MGNDVWIARQVNHDSIGRFCCYRWSTLINYNKTFCNGAFFDSIKRLRVFVSDSYLYLITCKSTISRFWMCWGWKFIIFDERNISLGPQGPTGTILVPVEIELVPLIGSLPSPPQWSLFNSPVWSGRVISCVTYASLQDACVTRMWYIRSRQDY